ncbi:MAG: hypothetical protein Q8N17_26460 [Burkholderiaceae bacterium]|nr:hypothetical protein [Burkholderiaceae bacterium]
MIMYGTLQAAEQARFARNAVHFQGHVTPVLGAHPVVDPARPPLGERSTRPPQAFLVEQAAGCTLRTHYHTEHQFQLVAAGGGTMGQHELQPLMVHYASPESGYGPIIAGDKGLSYYTLRAVATQETLFLPESRPIMRAGLKKKHAYAGPVAPSAPGDLAARTERVVETLMTGDEGLGAWMARLPARAEVDEASSPWTQARYYYVAAGEIEWSGEVLTRGAMVYADARPDVFSARAGASGAEVLVMQFPEGVR